MAEAQRPELIRRPTYHRPSHFRTGKADVLHDPTFNKGTSFTDEERKEMSIRGLLPPRVETLDEQAHRVFAQFSKFTSNLEKYIYLNMLQGTNETLFYRVLMSHLEETMPIVYTPTVGEACQKFGENFRIAQGMYFTKEDKGQIRSMLDNWKHQDVSIIVVTDGSRILGLGDLGANGMGIPIGKLSLYVAGAGFHPSSTLPVQLDLGTNRETLLEDPNYLGRRYKRIGGDEYDAIVEEFVTAVFDKWPNVLLQFEDFSNDHAFALLDRYKTRFRIFNDDIEGTGAVVVAGFINSLKVANLNLLDTRLVFFGAGSAGVGVADTIVGLFVEQGLTPEQAREHFWFVDSRGLVTNNRGDELADHKIRFARKDCDTQITDLLDVIKFVKPNVLIGLAGIGRAFNEEIVREFSSHTEKPIIMALSNPTSKAECTAEQAIQWTDGKVIFASGSPFDPVEYNGKTIVPGQGNNMFIFPGLGFGSWIAQTKMVSNAMILESAKVLAAAVDQSDIDQGKIYPAIKDIRSISVKVATGVIRKAKEEGLVTATLPGDDEPLEEWVESQMYMPAYL